MTLRPGAGTLLLFFTLFGWPRAARRVRAQVLSERSKGYVEAAQLQDTMLVC
jgi:ABC-type dipeptide/oligopeptide/nickel transport system permease subunit